MRRRVFTILSALSLLVCVAVFYVIPEFVLFPPSLKLRWTSPRSLKLRWTRGPVAIFVATLLGALQDPWYRFSLSLLRDPELASVPVLCVSAVYERGDVERDLGLRCLQKPIDFEEVLAEIAEACRE